MTFSTKLKSLTAAVFLLVGSQAANALTPADGLPQITVFTSGGAAQDKAYQSSVLNVLAEPGTAADIYEDDTGTQVGSRWTGYYFIGRITPGPGGIPAALPTGLAGQRIYLEKRSFGAAGYGVVPLANNPAIVGNTGFAIDHLNIFLPGAYVDNGTVPSLIGLTVTKHKALINAGNATSYLTRNQSHGGFTGVDAEALLQPGTFNYPAQVTELLGALSVAYPTALNSGSVATNTRLPTGGLTYGVGVTESLYRVLQVAQKAAGSWNGSAYGAYATEADLPSLSRNFLAALLTGGISKWDNVKFVDRTGLLGPVNTVYPLNHPLVIAEANLGAPKGLPLPAGVTTVAPSISRVAVGRRNNGAAIGAVAHAKLLNYPFVTGSTPPSAATPPNSATLPFVALPGGASASDTLLTDWEKAANNSTLNTANGGATLPAPLKLWGIAVNSGDRNTTGGVTPAPTLPWRYVKIDGYAGTIGNVASGNYPYWAEGEVLIEPAVDIDAGATAGATADKIALLTAFANGLKSSDVVADINPSLKQPYGSAGIFPTTQTDTNSINSIPFDENNPIVGLSHISGSFTRLGIVPKPFANPAVTAAGGNVIELR
jgi:hypothetical protein